MDAEVLLYIILFSFILFLVVGNMLRLRFLRRAEKMSEQRSVNSIQGREVIARMMEEENITDVNVEFSDFIVPRYYYNSRRKRITIPTSTNYGSGLYDVMRCATMASHAIFTKNDKGGLYYRFSPFMEVWARIMPLFFVTMLIFGSVVPMISLMIMGIVYLLSVISALMMRRNEGEAASNAARWLVKNGVVSDVDSDTLSRLTSYITNYNLVNVLMSGFAIASARRPSPFTEALYGED